MLGLPEEEGDRFRKWIHEILEAGITRPDILMKAMGETSAYFQAEVEKRRADPRDDLITQLAHAKIDGQPITEDHLLGALRLMLIAGIDTTWSAIGSCFWHLAQHPEDRRRLVAEPDLIPTAVEEFLRAYAPVTMAREVVKDTTINGCPMKSGEMVLLSFPAANRDPEMFPDADRVVIDRKENRHAAFGLGIHRCIGSNLARMEITVALQEWLKRIPDFRLDPSAKVTWSEGTVRGPRKLPVLFGRASQKRGRNRGARAIGCRPPHRAYLGAIRSPRCQAAVANAPLTSRPLILLAAFAGVLIAATLVLWAHYGTAVFFEIIAAGIAACF